MEVKKMKKLMSLFTVLALVLSSFAFAAEGDIVDVASKNGSFTVLVAALQEAELVETLEGEGPFTVFAPTDDAFAALLEELDITAADLLAHPQLSEVLLFHVVSGKVMSTDLTNGMMAETVQSESLKVDLMNGVMINDSKVVTADLEATNGVIHVIDKVLVPSTFKLEVEEDKDIVDIALGNPDFSMLVSLLQEAELVSVLQGEGPFTVFAPTNAAFEQLLMDLDITASELMAQPDLSKVLLYHVLSGKVMSTDLVDGMMAATVNGNDITVDLSEGVMINNSSVISADIEATNGVVHVIDRILVPANFTLAEVDMSEDLPQTGNLGLIPYGLLGILSLGSFTVLIKRKK
jgi:transforming growth factor-beta-induced protein